MNTTISLKPVNKYTRAGNKGKVIICPLCNTKATVYHFAWSAIVCQSCKQMINKTDYLLEVVNNEPV